MSKDLILTNLMHHGCDYYPTINTCIRDYVTRRPPQNNFNACSPSSFTTNTDKLPPLGATLLLKRFLTPKRIFTVIDPVRRLLGTYTIHILLYIRIKFGIYYNRPSYFINMIIYI